MRTHALLATAGALLISTTSALATPVIFDRGLPSINLNNAAGANRSNVSWSVEGGTGFTGDDFRIGSVGETYRIDTLTVWGAQYSPLSTDIDNIWLYLGKAGDALSLLATGAVSGNTNSNANITHSAVTYADNSTNVYQGWAGGEYSIVQTVFSGLNLVIEGGVTYNFGVDGDKYEWWSHASNAALSGTPQQGADGKYLVLDSADLSSVQTVDSSNGNGWDKSSDINVQITGAQVPEPTTLALVGLALAGLGLARRRQAA